MPDFYEGEPIVRVNYQISRQDYADAWKMYQSQKGVLRYHKVTASLFFAAGLIMALATKNYYARFGTVWMPVSVMVLCVGMMSYYLLYLPDKVKKQGTLEYESNKLIALPQTLSVYRDSCCEENPYEKILIHWTDRTGCAESDSLFVVMGGWDRKLLIIPKNNLTQQECNALTEHFSNVFVKKYKKM